MVLLFIDSEKVQVEIRYEPAEIGEYESKNLEISLLQGEQYVKSLISPTFPTFSITELIPLFVEMAQTTGMSSALKAFRQSVREQIEDS